MYSNSICFSCINCIIVKEKIDGAQEDCYPSEAQCSEEEDNFLSSGGCYKYESP